MCSSDLVPLPVVRLWATQFYPWLASVPIAMAERFANCSWEPANDTFRRMILDQLVEEAGDPKGKSTGHPELWLRFCEGLGLARSEVQSASLLPSTMVAIDDFLYTNRVNSFYVSAAGSSEPPNVELCARLLPAFRKHYQVDEAHLEYYMLHVVADVEHSEWIGQIVAHFASTPEVRHQMWDQMLRGFAIHAGGYSLKKKNTKAGISIRSANDSQRNFTMSESRSKPPPSARANNRVRLSG